MSPLVPDWFQHYTFRLAKWDVVAGITLAFFVLPESMAYALLAGLPSQFGIYACMAGCLAFALLTGSRQVAVGPTSAISLMIGSTLAVLSAGSTDRWLALASLAALMVFVLCLIAFFFRLNSLVNFISENILLGFKAGAALSIASTQLPVLFGIESDGGNFYERVVDWMVHLPETNLTVLVFGAGALAILVAGHRYFPGRPVSLMVVVASIVLVVVWPQVFRVLPLSGYIPSGLPSWGSPSMNFEDIDNMLALAFGIFLMAYIETMAAARTFAEKHGYQVNPRRELLSLGAANLASAIVGGYPVAGGMSQTTVNDKAGAKTPFALVICGVSLGIILASFTGWLERLPAVVLAVLVIHAVFGLINLRELKKLYKLSQVEFLIAMLAIAGVLAFGILKGILIASMTSIVYMLARTSSPTVSVLGRIPGTMQFTDISRHPDNEEVPRCKVVRIESSLFYFNQQFVHDRITQIVSTVPDIRLLVIDLSSSPMVDVSGAAMLRRLQGDLASRNIDIRLVNALAEVRDRLRLQGLEESAGHISRRMDIDHVIRKYFD